TPCLGYAQQCEAVFEGFGQRDGRTVEPVQQGLQASLALYQRLRTEISTVECKEVERPQVYCPGPAHLQSDEVGAPEGIVCHDLAVEHCSFGRQLAQQPCDRREALCEVTAVAAEDRDDCAPLGGLEPGA